MDKRKLVSSSVKSSIVELRHEPHLKLQIRGISHSKFMSDEINYSKASEYEIFIPLWSIPYIMKDQRNAVAEFEEKELDFLNRIKKSYNTEVQKVK